MQHEPAAETVQLSLEEVRRLAGDVFRANGVDGADILANVITRTERDGPVSHGLAMLPNYVSSLRCGWVDGRAGHVCDSPAPGVLSVDGGNGFAQIAIARLRDQLAERARAQGIAVLSLRNAHHIGALRTDVEPLAERGLVAIAMSSSRLWLVPWQGERPAYGTNPMAFAAPCEGRPPVVWDQASSAIAISDIRLSAVEGRTLRETAGLDSDGKPTDDAAEIMRTGRLLPFGRHKGSSIAFMIEVLAAALTGRNFAIEDRSGDVPGAASGNGGQMIIAIDPRKTYGEDFPKRLEPLLDAVAGNGEARVPGDGRLARREQTVANGVSVNRELIDRLDDFVKK